MKILLYILVMLGFSCDDKDKAPIFQDAYNLEEPSTVLKLNHDLLEISALSTTNDLNDLLAVNDEEGIIFEISKSTGEIQDKFDFESKGDYEGVEQVKNKVYVTDNSGDIYVYKIQEHKKTKKHYKTHLSTKNDIEGLTFDSKNNELLLACKGSAGKDIKAAKAIYAFDLEEKELGKTPKFLITDQAISNFVEEKYTSTKNKVDLLALKKRAKHFAPSGITIHPQSDKIYVLSSRGKLIVVLQANGDIDEVYFLNDGIYFQPEGICIDENLTLYISSEGKTKKSKLFEFEHIGIK